MRGNADKKSGMCNRKSIASNAMTIHHGKMLAHSSTKPLSQRTKPPRDRKMSMLGVAKRTYVLPKQTAPHGKWIWCVTKSTPCRTMRSSAGTMRRGVDTESGFGCTESIAIHRKSMCDSRMPADSFRTPISQFAKPRVTPLKIHAGSCEVNRGNRKADTDRQEAREEAWKVRNKK